MASFANRIKFLALILTIQLLVASCSATRSSFTAISKIETTPKPTEAVQYCEQMPNKAAIQLGIIRVNGNGFTNFDGIIAEAKKKAAELGGDFILLTQSGVETSTTVTPGYTTYQATGSANIYGNSSFVLGTANQQATGYSVGPSVNTYHFPWAVFSVGVYKKAKLGIDWSEDNIVERFNLNSNAEASGVTIGDKLLGIDNYDLNDADLSQHLMNVLPGDKVIIHLLRDGTRIDCTMTALPN